jgi:hypothetical protein
MSDSKVYEASNGAKFTLPKMISNARVARITDQTEHTDGERYWFQEREKCNAVMREILDGNHDGVDWYEEDCSNVQGAYRDFFDLYRQKMGLSEN